VSAVRALVERRPGLVTATDKEGYTALHHAAREGHAGIVRYLVSRGADLEAGSGCGTRPLHLAALNGNYEVVAFLMEQGADINAQGGSLSKMTPLEYAMAAPQLLPAMGRGYALRDRDAIVKLLQSHGAER
jgi:ankyrin repeat protein